MPAVTSGYGVGECASPVPTRLPDAPSSGQRVRLLRLTPRTASKLMLYPRLKFQIGREAHANVGSCVSAYRCDHGSHGRLWCACFSSKGALCVRCMAEIGPCRELPPSPDAPGGGPRCTSRSILPPCPNKRPGVGRCGGERGEYRARAPARSGSPLLPCLPPRGGPYSNQGRPSRADDC